ncbi:MAG: sigma-70 family RNA polymerase sigma factor [Deltaproteobacteria bacterium]|nr:sigma-70 family RNA polymerase sigma factor [Deltaproteobacteria bacterium]
MKLKQIVGHDLENDVLKGYESTSSNESEQNSLDDVIEIDFSSNKNTYQELEKNDAQLDTEKINQNYRLQFAYYKDLNGEELLNKRDEVVLSAQMKICKARAEIISDYLSSKSSKNEHTAKRKRAYLETLLRLFTNRALKLKEKFIKSNLRFVIELANRYQARGLPMSDLIQEGNIGLMKAVEKYDHTKGFKFSTYSAWWIHQSLSRAIMEQTKVISIPVYLQEQGSKVYRTKAMLEHNTDKVAQPEEIAQVASISADLVSTILKGRELTVPLELSAVDEDTRTYLDIVPDPNSKRAEHYIAAHSMTSKIRNSLSRLSEREREILKMRFGIDYEDTHKLDQIAIKYGLSRERIRQIETIALNKLADSEDSQVLKEYLT